MLKDIIILLIGAFLGYLPVLIPYIKKKKWELLRKKRTKILDPSRLYSWLIKYYSENNNIDNLYHYETQGKIIIVPFLTSDKFLFYEELNIKSDPYINFQGRATNFPINHKLIQRKQKFNQKLFNEPTLIVDNISINQNTFIINSKECQYFQLVTSISELEEENVKAIKRNKTRNLKIRDNYLFSTGFALKPSKSPYSLGAVVLLAFKTTSSYEILIHKRSSSTATFSEFKSVIPSYGLTSFQISDDYQISISFYNFIKEFAEELLDYEELIQQMKSKRGDQYWFLETDDVKEIYNSFSDSSKFIYTGFGIDTVNGTYTSSYLAIFNDLTLSRKIKSRMRGNWEVDSSDSYLSLEFIDILDPRIISEIENNYFHYGSAFCLARGIEYLKNNFH